MRDRMERFVILPFSVGCISESSVAVLGSPLAHHNHKRSKSYEPDAIPTEEEEERMKNMFKFLALSKPEISTGFNRLFKGFKTFSQLFAEKEEEFEEDMEIGSPTDVKHVTHIGLDGPVTSDPETCWPELVQPLRLPQVSFSGDSSHLVND